MEHAEDTVRESQVQTGRVLASLYRTVDGGHYFCCDVCGNCGQVWHGRDYALVQALHHIMFYNHTQYLEDHHGHGHSESAGA